MATAIAPPPEVVPQHMKALDRANEIRLQRAELRREVKRGERSVIGVIQDPPSYCQAMAIFDLLMAQRRWGKIRANKFLRRVPLSEKKTIGTLTDRQRATLAKLLRSR